MRRSILAIAGLLALTFRVALADAPAPAPTAANDADQPEIALDVEREIDIANIVTSAAKGVTTVQEAPSIVTIITAEEIKQRGWKTVGQAIATIPGWLDIEGIGNQTELPMVRGTVQAALFLRDGVSFFDPTLNVATLSRAVPIETIKRIEVVTGPGGVLWGANSYLGIVNLITKDAEDVGGAEFSVGYGDGRGDRSDFRGYAMYGHGFFGNRLRTMLHASFEDFQGSEYTAPQYYAASPAPQPAGPSIIGANNVDSAAARSWLLNLDGKVTFGPLSFYGAFPIGRINHSLGFSSVLVTNDMAKDADKATWNFYDRYAILEYKDRFFKDRVGLNAKAYYIQFNRDFTARLYPASGALPEGFSFKVADLNIQRFGGTLDADLTGPWSWNRVLVGAEAFNERTDTSHINVFHPSDPGQIPIICPLDATGAKHVAGCPVPFIFGTERTVVGAFIDDQIRPIPQLTLDGGIRYQQGFGKRGYVPQILGSAALVAQFYPDMHLKLNFAQGFRAPVFNNTDGNGHGVEFGGNPNLKVERSESYQAELNARVLKNVRKIRELQLRVDYAYTILDDFITIRNSAYTNAGKRGIHTVEALAKLYLNGDHYLTAGYTFMYISTVDQGVLRSTPNHWLTLGAVFNLVKDVLDVNGNLSILGSYEDPNRYRSGSYTLPGGGGIPTTIARATDLTFDQLTPVAVLQLGVRVRLLRDRLTASVQAFNVLNQHYAYPDPFYDQAPTIEVRPNPAPAFSFFTQITFRP